MGHGAWGLRAYLTTLEKGYILNLYKDIVKNGYESDTQEMISGSLRHCFLGRRLFPILDRQFPNTK